MDLVREDLIQKKNGSVLVRNASVIPFGRSVYFADPSGADVMSKYNASNPNIFDEDEPLHDRDDDLFDQLNDYHAEDGAGPDGEGEEAEEIDEREYNLAHAYTSLVLLSLVLVSFTWARNILSEAYGYKGRGDG
jgi:hypothetical protein